MSTCTLQITETAAENRVKPCCICGTVEADLVSNVDRENKFLRTVICKGCGLVYTQVNRIQDIKRFYTHEYRSKAKKPALKHVFRHGRNALSRYARLKKHLRPNHKIVDIGSGNGEFVYLLSYLGLNARGIEPHERFARYAREEYGVPMESSFLEEFAGKTTEKFDMVTLFHVLEHKEDPFETLSIIHNMLNDDGICVVEVPNISARCISPKNLFHIDHLFNFNARTLAQLGKKAGFTVVETGFMPIEGNVMVFYRKTRELLPISLQIPDNYRKVRFKLKTHTMFTHYCTPIPYLRLLKKGLRVLVERGVPKKFNDRKTILNTLYQNQAKPR